jgi:hypothetical protein
MSMKLSAGVLALTVVAGLVGAAEDKVSIAGEYLETRSCDVWTGPCFSNAEYGVVGDLAIVGWMVEKGAWNGVSLDGRKIVAILDADGTFMTNLEGAVRAGVYIDRAADDSQAAALLALARSLAPAYLKNVVKVERREIAYSREGSEAKLVVGDAEARVETGSLSGRDCICGNEEKAYGPFSGSVEVDCAKALAQSYRGTVLEGQSWSYPNKRSAMVGRFAR